MEHNKVRIINTKTGLVKFVEPHIGNNSKLIKSYGFIKQDHPKEENKELKVIVVPKPEMEIKDNVAPPETMEWIGDVLPDKSEEEKARDEYLQLIGKKAGNKKLENILKEIEEHKTIQN